MTLNELVQSIHSPMMADRETVEEAFEYVMMVAKASDNPMAVLTAVYVMNNTIAKQLKEIESV